MRQWDLFSLKPTFILKEDGRHIPADFTGIARIINKGITGHILPHLKVGMVKKTA
jgi:hypothetical protein